MQRKEKLKDLQIQWPKYQIIFFKNSPFKYLNEISQYMHIYLSLYQYLVNIFDLILRHSKKKKKNHVWHKLFKIKCYECAKNTTTILKSLKLLNVFMAQITLFQKLFLLTLSPPESQEKVSLSIES